MAARKQASRDKGPAQVAHPSKANLKSMNLAKLGQDRAAHMAELERLRASLREIPETSIEEGDPAVFERENTFLSIRRVEDHIAEIDRALKAARLGGYGICERCGQPIEADRLRILPETRVCAKCKIEQEKSLHRQPA